MWIFRPPRYILPSENIVFDLSIQFWVLGTYKSPTECQKSNFGSVNNLLCKLPFQATIHSGLFDLYGLQISKYWNLCFINSKGSQIYQKIWKNCIFDSLAFDLAFATFVGLFSIFLKSLMPDKTSGGQKLIILSLFHQKKKMNEIWHFRSVCSIGNLNFPPKLFLQKL